MEALTLLAKAFENRAQIKGVTPITGIHSSLPKNKNITNCYYLLTEIPALKFTASSTLITKAYSSDFNSAEANQISIISLSKLMFDGTKPMQGAELKALHKAMKKQRTSNLDSL